MSDSAYGLVDVDRLVRRAAGQVLRARGGDPGEEYAAAWHAIVELAYSGEGVPESHLVRAGRLATLRYWRDEARHHGRVYDHRSTGERFTVYWRDQTGAVPDPATVVTNRVALAQIWPALDEGDRAVLVALAMHTDTAAAAAAVGVCPAVFRQRLGTARRRFLRLWHQGERPSRVWRPGHSVTERARRAYAVRQRDGRGRFRRSAGW